MNFKNLSEFGIFLKRYSDQFRGKSWYDTFIEKYNFIKSCCKCDRSKSISGLIDYVKMIPDHIDQDSLDKIFSIVESDSVSVTHQSETILFLNKS